jgi:hypothetical protein
MSTIIDNAMRGHQPRYHKPHSTMPIRCNRGKTFETEGEFFRPRPAEPEPFFGRERVERPHTKPAVYYPQGWFSDKRPSLPKAQTVNLATANMVHKTPEWLKIQRQWADAAIAQALPQVDPEVEREQQAARQQAERERKQREEQVDPGKVYVTPPEPWYVRKRREQNQ